jgi:hypothetical protein
MRQIIPLVALLFAVPAYAGQGWYLLVPPQVPTPQGSDRWLTEAPLKKWWQNRAFDSALACERYLDDWNRMVLAQSPQSHWFSTRCSRRYDDAGCGSNYGIGL